VIRLFLITLLLFINLDARDNPFFPSDGEKDIPFTTNEDQTIEKLKRATIKLPSYARVIKKITIEYKNLDASIENKTIELNNAIDWHLPIFISQSYENQTSFSTKSNLVKLKHKKSYKMVGKIKYAQFYTSEKSFKIITKDKILRNFLLVQPHRIVIDFKRDAHIKTYSKKLQNSVFTKIRVGNHSGYYRVVIELDGYYRYKLDKIKNGYIIKLK